MDQIFVLQQIFERSWKYEKEFNACFVDIEKTYNRIPRDKLWAMLLLYGIDGQWLTVIKSPYMHSKVCVRVNGATTQLYRVNVGLRQGCSFSPILFLICMDRIVTKSESCGGVKIGDCTVQRLSFADDLVLLDSTRNGFLQALDRLSCVCSVNGIEIRTTKNRNHMSVHTTEAVLSTNWWCTTKTVRKIQVSRRFIIITSEGRQHSELDIRIGKASAVSASSTDMWY